jgi:hypothetical protein
MTRAGKIVELRRIVYGLISLFVLFFLIGFLDLGDESLLMHLRIHPTFKF